MKAKKGRPNYLYEIKKYDAHTCIVEWSIIFLLFVFGYVVKGTILNVISLFTIIGMYFPIRNTKECLKKQPFKPMDSKKNRMLMDINEHIHILYNPIMEFRGKVMGIESIVISGNTVLVYISNSKTNAKYTEKFLTAVLSKRVEKLNIKFFTEFKSFYDRAEGLHNMAKISQSQISVDEKKIMGTIFKYYI